MSSTYELVIDTVPIITDDECELALRLVNRQPDAALLRQILGLDPRPEPPREPKVEFKGLCKKHLVKKRVRPSGQLRCPACQADVDRRKRERRRQERARDAQANS